MQTGTDSRKTGMRASLGQITASESWKHQRNAEETKPKYNQDATFYLFVIVLTSLCLFVFPLSHPKLSHCRCKHKQTKIKTRFVATRAFSAGSLETELLSLNH